MKTAPFDPEKLRREFGRSARAVDEATTADVLRRGKTILERANRGPLRELREDIVSLLSLVGAYVRGEYRGVPYFSIAGAVAALAYVLSPVDFIPDAIPGLGLVDDAFVVSLCLRLLREDLERFRAWRAGRETAPPGEPPPPAETTSEQLAEKLPFDEPRRSSIFRPEKPSPGRRISLGRPWIQLTWPVPEFSRS